MPFSPVAVASPASKSSSAPVELVRALGWTIFGLAAVTGLKLVAFDYIGAATPFLLYFVPIIVGAWYGGWPGGLAVSGVSAVLGLYFFIPPFRSLHFPDFETSIRVGVFLTEGVAITAIVARLRSLRARTEAAATQSRTALAQLEGVLRGVADGVTVQTARGQLLYVNDLAARLTGFASAVEMLATPVSEIMARFELLEPDGRPFDVSQLPGRLALQGRPAPERLVQFRIRSTGQVRFALVRATAVKLPGQGAAEEHVAVNVFQDVTDRRKEEEARRELGEWLATTLRSIGDAVIATDGKGRVRFMNPLAERLTGTSSVEAEGQSLTAVFRIINEDTREPVASPVELVLRDGQVVVLANHTVLIAKDGSETAIDDSAAPIRSPTGDITGTVLVFRDVSERRAEERRRAFVAQASAELSRSLDYKQTLTTLVHLAVPTIGDWCAIDMLEGERLERLAVHHVDREKVELVYEIERRYPSDPRSGQGAYAVVRNGQPILLTDIPDAMLEAGARDKEHLQLIRRLQLRSFLAVPLRVDGIVIGVLTLATAESGRRLGQADLEAATALADRAGLAVHHARLYAAATASRAEAERANAAKDEFLAMLGHELRNPLSPIVTALQLMKMRGPEAFARERAIIERQVKHVVELMDDLLDVSRITRGKLELVREPVDLAETVNKALEVAGPLLESKRHNVSASVPRGALVLGDATRLVQVLTNLVVNAAKYTSPGGRIEVTVTRAGTELEVRVRDNGEGIGPELLPHVFDLFVQGSQSLHREKGGLGLGLTIVRSVVELHGGRVSAESAGPGQGSEFRVVLPAIEGAVVPRQLTPIAVPVAGERNVKVLVVDDNEDALELLADSLRVSGFQVTTAADAAAALSLAAQSPPDVALLDIGLPVMDGYELARRIRDLPGLALVKLIAITGYGQPGDKSRAEAAGFQEHLTKPVSFDLLEEALTRVLGSRP